MSSSHATTLVIIRHGVRSNAAAMAELEKYMKKTLPGCEVDNEDYDWGDFVLHNGIALAEHVLGTLVKKPALTKVIFAGHSQGGLVCRVAVATLCARTDLREALRFRGTPHGGYYTHAEESLDTLPITFTVAQLDAARDAVFSVLMLGTPNAGSLTNGQMALEATLVAGFVKKIGSLRWKNFDELTGDRLFTILQKVRVRRVQYVSISGSSVSRYSTLASSHLSLAQIPVIGRLAPSLDLPNDGVVEDSSVDLRESPLPSEVADLERQYQHVRSYIECVRMGHTALHSDPNVFEVLDHLDRWK